VLRDTGRHHRYSGCVLCNAQIICKAVDNSVGFKDAEMSFGRAVDPAQARNQAFGHQEDLLHRHNNIDELNVRRRLVMVSLISKKAFTGLEVRASELDNRVEMAERLRSPGQSLVRKTGHPSPWWVWSFRKRWSSL
jgi:hypothetical protein